MVCKPWIAPNLKVGAMKSLVSLFEHLLADAGRRCNAHYRRDIVTLSRRVEYEGDSFLTITLPRIGLVFERALANRELSPTAFSGLISRDRQSSCLPSFLKGFMSKVFDSTGRLLDNPSGDCILAIRQICYMVKKIERPCTKQRESDAEKAFIKCEDEVSNDDFSPLWGTFSKVCRIVMSDILGAPYYEQLVPRHGSGTTAERILGNKKYVHRRWHTRLDTVFPYSEFALGSIRNLGESGTPSPLFVEPENEDPVRVVFVPKTMKSPRVIAIEPVCMQYAQQALLQWLTPRIESGRFTSGHVNFRDQTVNQLLAKEGSSSGKYATLDLSEASDRVSLAMAKAVYSICPDFWDIVEACRSRRAILPSGKTIPLKKFASMGSAMCFPTEALVFFCTIVASRIDRAKAAVDARSVRRFSRDVYVYGDDIIVPTDEALATCDDLHAFGLKVNYHKSFWTGKFRESCGSDYYDNLKVTPVYLRHDLPTCRHDSSEIISSVSTSNQLFSAGYYRTATAIKEAVERIGINLPTVSERTSAIGVTYYSLYEPPTRYNEFLQRREIRCLVPVARRNIDVIDDDPALVKCFGLLRSQKTTSEPDHLLKSVGRARLTLKTRWVQA